MLEITFDNCYKCNLETSNDPNNSQYFWINRSNWQVIFDKHGDSSTQKYKK